MSIPNSHIRSVLTRYLDRYPEEAESVHLLQQALEADHELSSRKEFRIGHATAGAVVLDHQDRALLIHHNALRTWLLPGGHLEPEDGDLQEAALRELSEETGLPPDKVVAVDPLSPWTWISTASRRTRALALRLPLPVPGRGDRGQPSGRGGR